MPDGDAVALVFVLVSAAAVVLVVLNAILPECLPAGNKCKEASAQSGLEFESNDHDEDDDEEDDEKDDT